MTYSNELPDLSFERAVLDAAVSGCLSGLAVIGPKLAVFVYSPDLGKRAVSFTFPSSDVALTKLREAADVVGLLGYDVSALVH